MFAANKLNNNTLQKDNEKLQPLYDYEEFLYDTSHCCAHGI